MKLKLWPILALLMFSVATVIGLYEQKLLKTELGATAVVEEQAPLLAPSVALVVHPPNNGQSVLSKESEGTTRYLQAQIATPAPDPIQSDPLQSDDVGWLNYVKSNFVTLAYALIAILEVIVRITPTERDNSLLSALKSLLDKLIPNRRVGGGTYEP